MTPAEAIEIFKHALWTSFLVSAPMLIFGLVAGLLISIFQAVTQIHETTLAFVPKILAVVVSLLLFLPWIITTMVTFTTELFTRAASLH